jgi:hypothetical protein
MRNSRALLYTLLAVVGLAARAAAQPPAAPVNVDDVPLFPTRQSAFDIPFQIEETAPGAEHVEVQLHVSENRGATWHLVAKAKPDEGRFSYKAAHDGELWFLVRTLNRQGRLLPEKPFAPELRVLVDTEPPLLELACKRGSAGEIDCAWKTSDPYLKVETLQLSYQGIDAGPNWQSVSVPPSTAGGQHEWTGRTTFVPTGAKWPLFVRVEVSDAAGNRAAAQSQVETPAGAGPTSLPIAAAPSGSPLTALPSKNDTPWTAATPTSPAIGSMADAGSLMKPASTGDATPPALPSRFPGSEAVPPVNREVIPTPPSNVSPYKATSEPRTTARPPLPKGPLNGNGPMRDETIGPGQVESLPSPTPDAPIRRTLEPQVERGPAMPTPLAPAEEGPAFTGPGLPEPTPQPREVRAPPTDLAPKPIAPPSSAAAANNFSSSTGSMPPGITPRMVNSRRFELEYDVESVGSSGVAKVELWTSRDAGRTWNMLGTDPDAASPYIVQVDEEGVYGFKIVIETASGLRSPTPVPGDLPEVWVGIDVTKPAAKLVSIQQRGLEDGGTLTIRWEASDRLLTDRPITLSFSDKLDGPWTTIAAGLPNTGVYDWPFDARTPERLYLRIEARDSAGNSTTYVLTEPTIIERVKPQGRIRGVRPLGESARLKQPSQILPR